MALPHSPCDYNQCSSDLSRFRYTVTCSSVQRVSISLDSSLSGEEIDQLIQLGLGDRHPRIVSDYRRAVSEIQLGRAEELKRQESMARRKLEAGRPSLRSKVLELMSQSILREFR